MADQVSGGHIQGGEISESQGVAVGRAAQVHVGGHSFQIGDAGPGAVVQQGWNQSVNVYRYTMPQPVDAEQLVAAVERLAALPLDVVPSVAPLPSGSRMPLARNPLFVGREAELRALARMVKEGETAAIVAATGLGGVGKTQVAIEFMHRYGQYFAGGVCWLSFAEDALVPAEVAACGDLQRWPYFSTLSLQDQVRLVLAEWQSALPRLLVFDNCEEEALLARWRPTTGGARVLVTSRRGQWEPTLNVRMLPVRVLPAADSIALLRKHRPDLGPEEPVLGAIAAELGHLALALHVAGSFLARYRRVMTPAAYLADLRRPDLLTRRVLQGKESAVSYHDLSVYRTFALSYDRLDLRDQLDAQAQALLARAAWCAPGEPLPPALLWALLNADEAEAEAVWQAEDALGRLVALGLLEEEADGAGRLHRLLASFVQQVCRDSGAQAEVEAALARVANAIGQVGPPLEAVPYLPHLRHAVDLAGARADTRIAGLLMVMASILWQQGDYPQARSLFERTLAIRKRVLGQEHPDTANCMNNLAMVLEAQGYYAAARPLREQVLSIWERVYGPNHMTIAIGLNNLAVLMDELGDQAAARPLHERGLAIRERVCGLEHPDTAVALNSFAEHLREQGDLAVAKHLHERALAIRERYLPADHPDMANSLNNLALTLQAQREYAAARTLHERALAIQERTLGMEHPRAANSLHNLASLLRLAGDDSKARPLFERALAIRERALGSTHPDTANSMNSLVDVLMAQKDTGSLRTLYERTLTRHEQQFGPEHPDIVVCLNNYAVVVQAHGDYAAARPLFTRALAIAARVLGPDHLSTALSLNNLACLLAAQGDYAAAGPLFERALTIREQGLPSDHPYIAVTLCSIGSLRQAQGDLTAARILYERALGIYQRSLGDEHTTTVAVRKKLTELAR